MKNEIIIPGKLEAAALGESIGVGQVLENGVILLNTDNGAFAGAFDEAKNVFIKALKMSNNKIVRLMFKKPKTRDEMLMQLAARLAYYQRQAAAIITLDKANNEVEAYLDGRCEDR